MHNNKSIIIAGFTVFVMLGFQNCSKAQFSASGDSSLSKGDSSNSGQSTGTVLVPIDDDGTKSPNSMPSIGHQASHSVGEDCDDDKEHDKKHEREDYSRPESDEDYVACILVDHGKSLKLGIVESSAGGVHSVAQSVCVTRHACLTQVAQHFAVEGAYERGYCDHNPHVRRLNDNEVKDLCTKN